MNTTSIIPTVGMGATFYCGSDRYPFSVVEVINERKCIVAGHRYSADKTQENGMGHQNWVIDPTPNGRRIVVTRRKDGRWRVQGVPITRNGCFYSLGSQSVYYCWEF